MVDHQQDTQSQKQLEAERQKLTEEQREKHDRFVALLQANETYTDRFAIEGAQAIYNFDGTHKLKPELFYIAQRADHQALVDLRKEFSEANKQKPLDERTHEPEQQKQQDAQKVEIKLTEVERSDPIEGTMQRFAAHMAEKTAQRARANNADFDRQKELAGIRLDYARYAELKQSTEPSRRTESVFMRKISEQNPKKGEISNAKAARFSRMFNNPSREKDFDASHDPGNAGNFSNHRGGRGER